MRLRSEVRTDDIVESVRVESNYAPIPVNDQGNDQVAGERLEFGASFRALPNVAIVELDEMRMQVFPHAATLLS